jgi:hypothetical protein
MLWQYEQSRPMRRAKAGIAEASTGRSKVRGKAKKKVDRIARRVSRCDRLFSVGGVVVVFVIGHSLLPQPVNNGKEMVAHLW